MSTVHIPSVLEGCNEGCVLTFGQGGVKFKPLPDGGTGPQGPPGPAGADSTVPGPQGPQGPAGADSTVPGPQGPQGPAGADSTVPGPQGPAGSNGAQGIQGIQGIQGPAGADGAAGAAGSPGPANLVMSLVSPADLTNNSNVNWVTVATRAIAANEKWSFEAVIFFLSAATTTGLVTAVDCPASPTYTQFALCTGESATAWRTLQTTTPGTAMTGTAALTSVLVAYVSGTVENGANAGTLTLKFRSEINASQITVKRGSFVRWMKH